MNVVTLLGRAAVNIRGAVGDRCRTDEHLGGRPGRTTTADDAASGPLECAVQILFSKRKW